MIRLALPRLSASIMISCSISHCVQRPWMRLQDERVAAADRLIEADENLAVGEIARGLRGDRDVELLGHLLSQFGVRAAREEHQILAVVGPLGAHCAPSLLGDRYDVIVRSLSAVCVWGHQIANGRRPVTRPRGAPDGSTRAMCAASRPS